MTQAQQCCFRRGSVTVEDGLSPRRTRGSRNRHYLVGGLAVEVFLNSDVRHGRRWRGATPMLLSRQDPDHVPRPNLLGQAAPAFHAAAASRHDQGLAHWVRVPCCASAGLCHISSRLHPPRSFRGRLLLLASECVFHAVRNTGASKEELAHSKSVTSLGRECGNGAHSTANGFLAGGHNRG